MEKITNVRLRESTIKKLNTSESKDSNKKRKNENKKQSQKKGENIQ